LDSDWLVVPDNVSTQTYEELIVLGDYFCVPTLVQICANEIMAMVNSANVENLLKNSIMMKLANVTRACSDFWIKKTTENVKVADIKLEITKIFADKKVAQQLEAMLAKIGFDLAQTTIENEKTIPNLIKKGQSSNFNMEK
jgi:hypothetical protein